MSVSLSSLKEEKAAATPTLAPTSAPPAPVPSTEALKEAIASSLTNGAAAAAAPTVSESPGYTTALATANPLQMTETACMCCFHSLFFFLFLFFICLNRRCVPLFFLAFASSFSTFNLFYLASSWTGDEGACVLYILFILFFRFILFFLIYFLI